MQKVMKMLGYDDCSSSSTQLKFYQMILFPGAKGSAFIVNAYDASKVLSLGLFQGLSWKSFVHNKGATAHRETDQK